MIINPLDAHDRLNHFTKQSFGISECCQSLIDKRPFGDYPFYIFAHARTHDDGTTKRIIWQPRLTKPKSQSNSMLFKVYPGTDVIKIIWMIPAKELWAQYSKGLLTENKIVSESIYEFNNHREKMDMPEPDDFNDEKINAIYNEISSHASHEKLMQRLYEPD